MRTIPILALACALLSAVGLTNAQAPTNTELLARVQQADPNAILEAGKTGDKSYIPILEKMAKPQFIFDIDPEVAKRLEPQLVEETKRSQAHPVYDEQPARHARMALARLGVKEYLDEILTEVANPTNSPVYKERERYPQYLHSQRDKLEIQMLAFEKLVYLKNPSTVKVLATFLYRSDPGDNVVGGDLIFETPSEMAMKALSRIVDNPPKIDLPAAAETHDARIKLWQQWWEQNKDKYP